MVGTTHLSRLREKSTLDAVQVELQQGYSLSPVEALVLARRVQELVDERSGEARNSGQVNYQAIAIDEPPPESRWRSVAKCVSISP